MTEEIQPEQTISEQTSERMKAYWARKRAAQNSAEPSPPAPEPEPKPEPKPESKVTKRGLNATQAAEARWAGEQATEGDLREHFKTLELGKAFALYERMRKNLETAGKILNDRANVPEIQYCKTCGVTMEEYKKRCRKNDWFLNRHHYHQGDRNIIVTEHFCSAVCVSLENNKTQGVYGMPDQGMLPSDNPKNHPREFPNQKRT